jgi:hypothetical protein
MGITPTPRRSSSASTSEGPSLVVGWKEWVAFPGLGLPAVHAKVDTGAATSSLHAEAIETFDRGGALWARFVVRPYFRRRVNRQVHCEAPVVDRRIIRSSSGHDETRLVVEATLRFGVRSDAPQASVEVTLTDRTRMRIPMLLGREALGGRALVDASRTYVLGAVDRPSVFYAGQE